MKIKFQNIGWKSKITQKRSTLSISINKLVATGCCLEKGQRLYCYLAEDKNKRPIMIAYLDSKEGGNFHKSRINETKSNRMQTESI